MPKRDESCVLCEAGWIEVSPGLTRPCGCWKEEEA